MTKANTTRTTKRRELTIQDHRTRLREAMAALAWHRAEIVRLKALMLDELEAIGRDYPGQL
jgi:hypothetical protein